MKLTSKELHGAYPFSNKQTDTIKKGSGGLGMAGQVPDGPGDSGMANMNTGPILKVGGVNEIKSKGVDLRTGGQLVPTRGDLTEEQNKDVLNRSMNKDVASGKKKSMTDKDKANMANTGNLLGSATAAGNELERRQGKKDALRKAAAKRKKEREANASTPTNMNKGKY